MAEIIPGWSATLRKALHEISELQKEWPDDEALYSVNAQLEYLLALADGTETDDSRLEQIIIGYLSVKSLIDILSSEQLQLLCQIQGTVRRYLRRQGRKPMT